MPRRTKGGDSRLFAESSCLVGVGDTGFRHCRPPGPNLSCESDRCLAMSAWTGALELALVRGEAVMDDILIRGGEVIDGTGAPDGHRAVVAKLTAKALGKS